MEFVKKSRRNFVKTGGIFILFTVDRDYAKAVASAP